jgi:hypothetical protein
MAAHLNFVNTTAAVGITSAVNKLAAAPSDGDAK